MDQYYCEKCNRTLNADQFYSSNNLEKYPNNGKFPQCKKCMTMHVDNFNPDTFLWILQEADVPYIPDEWNKLMMHYASDPAKVTGTTILGRYLSKMKLKQWRDFRWKDNEFIQEMLAAKLKQTMQKEGYEAAQIAQAIQQQQTSMTANMAPMTEDALSMTKSGDFQNFPVSEPEIDLGLTEEDITYLRLKWGKNYKQEEWVALEQLYQQMMESYDIQTAGHIDTLKLACKASLKANQLMDIGDVDGALKMIRVYDTLMKAGKFTAAQNKAEQGEYVDSISELVALCETDGFIPRYYTDGPQDNVDHVLLDMQHYTKQLVTEEMGLGNLIENAIKQLEKDREAQSAVETTDDEDNFDKMYDYDAVELTDQDFSDLYKFEEEQADADDEEFLKQFMESEDDS